MKFWEVLKELTEDPTKRFERKDRYKHWVIGTDVVDASVGGETYYFMLDCDGEDSFGDAGGFSGNIKTNLDDWQLVRQPVTWQEAILEFSKGNKVVVKFNCQEWNLRTLFELPEYLDWAIIKGKWYVGD